jgi:hypothetical protein
VGCDVGWDVGCVAGFVLGCDTGCVEGCVEGCVAACVVAAGCVAAAGVTDFTSDNDAEIVPNFVCAMVIFPSAMPVTTPVTRSPLVSTTSSACAALAAAKTSSDSRMAKKWRSLTRLKSAEALCAAQSFPSTSGK